MRLLISVKSAAETVPALAGGADIIDAKDPSRGSLGAVVPDDLAAILARVPDDHPFSVALGDVATIEEVRNAIASMRLPRRPGPVFIKLGFAGVRSAAVVGRLLECAVAQAAGHGSQPRVVAVAYADAARAGALPPRDVPGLAASAAAAGVLLDTHIKDGRGVLRALPVPELAAWVASVRSVGLLSAIAGEIGPADLPAVTALEPDIVGVRGAACEGGRAGVVTAERVRLLRQNLNPMASLSWVV